MNLNKSITFLVRSISLSLLDILLILSHFFWLVSTVIFVLTFLIPAETKGGIAPWSLKNSDIILSFLWILLVLVAHYNN